MFQNGFLHEGVNEGETWNQIKVRSWIGFQENNWSVELCLFTKRTKEMSFSWLCNRLLLVQNQSVLNQSMELPPKVCADS